jgi:hypothetical protein
MYEDNEEDEFDEVLEHLMKHRKDIEEPLTEEDAADLIEQFAEAGCGFLEVCLEKYHLGGDEDGYIILANVTPHERNPESAYYFILRHPDFKRTRKFQYKIDFISAFSEDESKEVDAETYTVGLAMNLYECMKSICSHWMTIGRD